MKSPKHTISNEPDMKTCINITYNWTKSTLIWMCVLLHNLRGRTVGCAPVSLISLSKVVDVENSSVSSSPKQANAALHSNETSSYKRNNTMVALSPEKLSTGKEISSDSDLNFTTSGSNSTLENEPPLEKPLFKKQKPSQANIETVLNITEASFYDLPDFQNDSEEYDPLLAYKMKRGLGESEKNSSEVPHPQTSDASDFTSSPTSVTETTALASESKTETTAASGSDDGEKGIEETTIPALQATNHDEPKVDIKSTKPIKSTQPEASPDQPNETGAQPGVDETTTQKESEQKATKASNTNENATEAEGPRDSDKEIEMILPTKDNGNTTGADDTPIVEYENDPKWYGNTETYIVDDYEVFKQRGCVDFSCKHDFE